MWKAALCVIIVVCVIVCELWPFPSLPCRLFLAMALRQRKHGGDEDREPLLETGDQRTIESPSRSREQPEAFDHLIANIQLYLLHLVPYARYTIYCAPRRSDHLSHSPYRVSLSFLVCLIACLLSSFLSSTLLLNAIVNHRKKERKK